MEMSVFPSSSEVGQIYQISQPWGLLEMKAGLQVRKGPNVASQQCAPCPRTFTGYMCPLWASVSSLKNGGLEQVMLRHHSNF